MKYYFFTFFILLSTFISPQGAKALDVYAFGSYWDVDDSEETFGGGFGASIALITQHLQLDARAYIFDSSDLRSRDSIDLVPIDLGLRFHILPDAVIDPYAFGGVSWIFADSDDLDIDSEFGVYVGAGLGVDIGIFLKPFAEIVYRAAELDVTNALSEDVSITGVTTNIGLRIEF